MLSLDLVANPRRWRDRTKVKLVQFDPNIRNEADLFNLMIKSFQIMNIRQ